MMYDDEINDYRQDRRACLSRRVQQVHIHSLETDPGGKEGNSPIDILSHEVLHISR